MRPRYILCVFPLLGCAACGDGDSVPTVDADPVVSIVEASPGLAERARISGDSALTIARLELPGGEIVEAELEEEDGLLVYAIDVKIEGQEGEYEVLVDATTGAVVTVDLDDDDDDDAEDDDDEEDDDEREASGGR